MRISEERDQNNKLFKWAHFNALTVMLMNIKEFFTPKRLIFIALFAVFAFITQKINFSALVGAENQFFTLFQFFGPIAGAFLGPIVGVIAVFLAEAADFLVVGKELTLINIARLAPMLFATYKKVCCFCKEYSNYT